MTDRHPAGRGDDPDIIDAEHTITPVPLPPSTPPAPPPPPAPPESSRKPAGPAGAGGPEEKKRKPQPQTHKAPRFKTAPPARPAPPSAPVAAPLIEPKALPSPEPSREADGAACGGSVRGMDGAGSVGGVGGVLGAGGVGGADCGGAKGPPLCEVWMMLRKALGSTYRETQVVRGLYHGGKFEAIAHELRMSRHTASIHWRHVQRNAGFKGRVELIARINAILTQKRIDEAVEAATRPLREEIEDLRRKLTQATVDSVSVKPS